MYVGKKIKQLRIKNGLSQEEFANRIEVSQAYYSSIERGKKKISRKMLDKVCELFSLDKSYFNEGDFEKIEPNFEKYKNVINGGINGGINEDKEEENTPISQDEWLRRAMLYNKCLEKIPQLGAVSDAYNLLYQFSTYILPVINYKLLSVPNPFFDLQKNVFEMGFDELEKLFISENDEILKNIDKIKEIAIHIQGITQIANDAGFLKFKVDKTNIDSILDVNL